MSLSQIYEGWKNHLLPEEKMKYIIDHVSQERMDICTQCEEHSYNKPELLTLRPDAHCTNCGCTLAAKTKCLSCECPLKKWGAVTPPNNEEAISIA
tara:strand:- start:376 stop:663 length:288 start_codon:yes stop_codon:yes gene_type:complete